MIVCFSIIFIGCNFVLAEPRRTFLMDYMDSGVTIQDGRIVGGEGATIEQFPYQVSVQWEGRHICGGSIISESWILTAAHCMSSPQRHRKYKVRSGSSYHDHGGRLSDVQKIIVHERYSPEDVDYDVATMKLSSPLTFGMSTMPIALATTRDYLLAGAPAIVTGWGTLKMNGPASRNLQKVEVPLIMRTSCEKAYMNQRISERMLCAGYLNVGGKDACQGDSGGPLVLFGRLIGIVSWGFGCAHPSYPGVYTRVSVLRQWISSKTGV